MPRPLVGGLEVNWQTTAARAPIQPAPKWQGVAWWGGTYQLEFSDELWGAAWTPLGEARVASATILVFDDPLGTRASRFYRVAGR